MVKNFFNNIEVYLCRVFFIGFISIVLFQVICREFFGLSIVWSEELSVYLFVWFVFFGASIAVTKGMHNRIDFQYNYLSARVVIVLKVLAEVIWLIFNIYFFYLCYDFVFNKMNMFWASQTTGIPMKIIYVIMPVSFLFITIRQILVNIKSIMQSPDLEINTDDSINNNVR